MACVFGEMRTLKTGWRWGQKTCPVLGKNKKTMPEVDLVAESDAGT